MASHNRLVLKRGIFFWLTISNFLYIIVLLILAGVSIAMLTGDNGLLTKASKATEETVHQTVLEKMRIEASTYWADKYSEGKYSTLIDYLIDKHIIIGSAEDEEWQIDVEILLGSEQKYGKGSNKKDVYMLEDAEKTGSIINTKVATTKTIKVASANGNTLIYNVVYYANPDSSKPVGTIADTKTIVDESSTLLDFFKNNDRNWYEDDNNYIVTEADDGTIVTRLDIENVEDDDHGYEYIMYKNQMYKLTYSADDISVSIVQNTNVNISKPGKYQVEEIPVLVTADKRVHNQYYENGVDTEDKYGDAIDYTYYESEEAYENGEGKEAKYYTIDHWSWYRWYDISGALVRVESRPDH